LPGLTRLRAEVESRLSRAKARAIQ